MPSAFFLQEFWNTIQFAFAAIGGWLGWFLGGCDGLLIALILFAVTDYITGFMCAVADKKLSSAVGFVYDLFDVVGSKIARGESTLDKAPLELFATRSNAVKGGIKRNVESGRRFIDDC